MSNQQPWQSHKILKHTRRYVAASFGLVLVLSMLAVLPANATSAGTVVAWGSNTYGQLDIPAGLSGVTAVAAGAAHTVALRNDGTVVAWGNNTYGQLDIPAGLSGVTAISAGWLHTAALKNDGTVVEWGAGMTDTACFYDCGQSMVPAGLSGVTAIAGGAVHTLALKGDGTVVVWGAVGYDLGATNVPVGLSGVTAIASGSYHNLALKNDGTVVAWGWNGAPGQTDVPVGLSGVTAIAAGYGYSLALKSDGTVVGWGGWGGIPPAGLSGVTAIAAGQYPAVALKNDGTVAGWGMYSDATGWPQPPGLSGVIAVAAGNTFTVAVVATPNNTAASAGANQTVHVGQSVSLDGSGSADSGGLTLTYQWSFVSKPAGSGAILSDPAIVNPKFTSDVQGDYVLQLVVTNSSGSVSSPSTVTISTTNTPPVADAGVDQLVTIVGTNVQLNGSQSYDPDGDPMNYYWTLTASPPGSGAALIGANSVTPAFYPDVYGTYVAQLVVSDPWASSQPSTVTISFEELKPVANAQQSLSIPVGTVAMLDGSGSYDANRDPLTYKWTFISLPANSQSVISSPTASLASFIPDLPGTYIAQLIVNDGIMNSDPSTVQFQVFSTESAAIAAATDIQAAVSSIPVLALKNANMKKTFLNKLNAAIASIDAGLYADALDQLKNDILGKTDGCATTGAPDKNDWITTCAAQNQVYPLIQETIWIIEGLLP